MKKSLIIAIVGMPGTGKSMAADFFRKKNIPVLRFGDQTDRELKLLRKESNEKNERWYREKIRKELGMAAMAIKIEPRIHKALKSRTIIALDGLYSWEEYLYLKNRFGDLVLLCIYASPPIRYRRLKERTVRRLTLEESRNRDIAELENLNKGGPIAIADYLIVNDTSSQKLYENLDRFLKLYETKSIRG